MLPTLHTFITSPLAHPLNADKEFDVSLLVGVDHYWDIVGDAIVRGDGPTAVESKVGYQSRLPALRTNSNNNWSIPNQH